MPNSGLITAVGSVPEISAKWGTSNVRSWPSAVFDVFIFNGCKGHVAECHERLLTGVELDNRKAACRERLSYGSSGVSQFFPKLTIKTEGQVWRKS